MQNKRQKYISEEFKTWLSLLSHVSTIAIFLITLFEVLPWLRNFSDTVSFQITYPLNGAQAGLTTAVAGTAPNTDRKIYVLVRTPANTEWTQPEQAIQQGDGLWSASAQIGEGPAGCGEDFLLRAILVKQALEPGVIRELPKNAILSNEVAVVRSKECGE